MNGNVRFTFDANVLVYATVRDVTARHATARDLLDRAVDRNCILIVQALAEFFYATTHKRLLPATRATEILNAWLELFPTAGPASNTLRRAASAVADHQLSFWDAMLWAVANEAGCRYLLTEDFQHGRTLERVTFVNPFTPEGLPEEVERALDGRR